MEEKSDNPPNIENIVDLNYLDKNDKNDDTIKDLKFIDDKDKFEIIKINDRIKIVENEMNNLICKIEKTESNKDNILKRLDDVGKEGIDVEKKYFDLKNKLDTIKPETEEEKTETEINKHIIMYFISFIL